MSAQKTTVLITGANRGIGRGLAEEFLGRPNHIVIAAVRDTKSSSTVSLKDVTPAEGTSLLIVKIDSSSETDPTEAVKTLETAGISSLDIVIANAGIGEVYSRVEGIEIDDFRLLFDVNTLGPLRLFKAVYPLLKATADQKGPGAPKFLAISTNASSITDLEANKDFLLGSYGAAKLALNYLVRRAHFETPWLTAFFMDPGFAQTDMGNAGAKRFGMETAFVTVKDSVDGITKRLDGATREETSGNFYSYAGHAMAF
ncbi:aflatoxin biosynthesis ketoreductase nor-1 [Thozetella sp. PMI_491]|nr:aflatoxin biosynthesis ketoreductase nor-1 [Thozetella sp. PMI_491]